jgi:hypothetical protein
MMAATTMTTTTPELIRRTSTSTSTIIANLKKFQYVHPYTFQQKLKYRI